MLKRFFGELYKHNIRRLVTQGFASATSAEYPTETHLCTKRTLREKSVDASSCLNDHRCVENSAREVEMRVGPSLPTFPRLLVQMRILREMLEAAQPSSFMGF